MAVTITLSPRLRTLFDQGKVDGVFKGIAKATADYCLGNSAENRNDMQAPLRKGFGPVKGSGNTKTKGYEAYSPAYAEWKAENGYTHWHQVTGDLMQDAIFKPKIEARKNGFTLTVRDGASSKYAGVQNGQGQVGKIPPRPYYYIDKSDMKGIALFIQKRLTQFFKSEAALIG